MIEMEVFSSCIYTHLHWLLSNGLLERQAVVLHCYNLAHHRIDHWLAAHAGVVVVLVV